MDDRIQGAYCRASYDSGRRTGCHSAIPGGIPQQARHQHLLRGLVSGAAQYRHHHMKRVIFLDLRMLMVLASTISGTQYPEVFRVPYRAGQSICRHESRSCPQRTGSTEKVDG